MGNHSIGRAFVAAAEAAGDRRRPGETALDILDEAAERTEIRGMDAEFDDAFFEEGTFRRLVIEAFAAGDTFDAEDDEGEDDSERFYEIVYRPFRTRYDLC